ncbi:MAG: Uma2 family endonuclease [Deinococcota bacterium]
MIVSKHRFSTDDYHSMIDAGILTENDRVELIEGDVIETAAIGSRHAACVKRTAELLRDALNKRALLGVQDPVILGDDSEPEPDLSVLVSNNAFYADAHPTASDIYLLIEVADSSLVYDMTVKLPLYARAGVPEVWLVNLVQNRVMVYRDLSSSGYTTEMSLTAGDSLSPVAFTDVVLDVASVLLLSN